jgi:hypothetical protein
MLKNKKTIITIIALGLIIVLSYIVIGNPIVFVNNQKLKHAVLAVDSHNILFNEIVPFEWDIVYTFEPYASKEKIEGIIGFKSNSIKETASEGMVQLLFIKNNKVVCSVCDYSSNLGYRIDFFNRIMYTDNAVFSVERDTDIIWLFFEK